MYLVLSAFTSSPVSLAATTKASAFSDGEHYKLKSFVIRTPLPKITVIKYAKTENVACLESVNSTRRSECSWKIWAEEISW
jgi:hypothetical protein